MTSRGRVDVHHHFVPARFAEASKEYGSKEWFLPEWTVEKSEELFKAHHISTAILSLTTPGVDVATSLDEQLAIAKDANATGSAVKTAQPTKFGFFATIPNPVKYPAAALSELKDAFDTKAADGLTLLTQYSGKYLGHDEFAPLWTELNRRKAVVFVHPTSPPGEYVRVSDLLLPPALDFTFETTKTACDLIFSGTTARYPDVKIILSHGGGTLPWSWHRPGALLRTMGTTSMTGEEFYEQASNFYYDTALTGQPDTVELLIKFAKPGHVLFGSDFPYAPNEAIDIITSGLDETLEKKDDATKESVAWKTAFDLFPRLRG